MVGDEEGVVCIPQHLAEEVAEAAHEQEKLERFIQYEIANGAPLRGTYPPDEDTLRRYHESRVLALATPPLTGWRPRDAGRRRSKLRLVLKRTSSPLNSHAAAANALSPAVDARVLGSAAMDAPSARC